MRRVSLLLPLFLVLPAQACLNDRDSDSLATQAAKFPDTLRVITGRFERNPPLFYQMRIKRESAQLKKTPRDFGLYDDIAVAFDKLHRDDDALRVMAQKRALLPRFDAKNAVLKEAWYRYYANAGTFRAHRFLGDKKQPISEMKQARDFIQRAIEIKPNAHFGREKYQLMTMDWIVATRTGKADKTLVTWLEGANGWEDTWSWSNDPTPKRASATEGLSGLIVLGAAWESADTFDALGAALQSKDGVTLRYLALLRCREILQNGKKPLDAALTVDAVNFNLPGVEYGMNTGIAVNKANQKTLDELFLRLRAEAETWNSQRQKYMMVRLERGQHPDWDRQFWADWKPAAPPSLDVKWFNEKQNKEYQRQKAFLVKKMTKTAVVLLAGALAIAWVTQLFVRSRKYRSNFLQ